MKVGRKWRLMGEGGEEIRSERYRDYLYPNRIFVRGKRIMM